MSFEIIQGDCIERMAEMEEASVDAVVCDPPYGISFMGSAWDTFNPDDMEKRVGTRDDMGPPSDSRDGRAKGRGKSAFANPGGEAGTYDFSLTGNRAFQAWCERWARECLRVLKPGGHLLAYGGSRTHHRLASGIEDAGFEIRDRIDTPSGTTVHTPDGTLAWYFGSGFPKGKDVHKALVAMGEKQSHAWLACPYGSAVAEARRDQIEAAVAELEQPVEDAEWQGWNVALKPAHEPIVVARKPLIGTVAANFLEHGTGGLNIDACRLGTDAQHKTKCESAAGNASNATGDVYGEYASPRGNSWTPDGRWPANVVLSEEAAAELDIQAGGLQSHGGGRGQHRSGETAAFGGGLVSESTDYRDSGGASRFFYCAKTSRAERNAGLEGFEERLDAGVWGGADDDLSAGKRPTLPRANGHPTVKPINLMRWLVRLVTPPGGTCLDPFLGSGTTGAAAVLEGFDFLGIEREAEYIAIAEARIAFWSQHVGREVEDVLKLNAKSTKAAKGHEDRGQGDLLALATETSGGGSTQMTVDDVLADIEGEAVR